VDGFSAFWVFPHHESRISQLALRDFGNDRRFVLWMDLAKDGIHFRFSTCAWRGGCGVALPFPDDVGTLGSLKLVEPATAIGKPPAKGKKRDGGGDGPPKRTEKVGSQARDCKCEPEDLALHGNSLTRAGRRNANVW
jgi:hypothetical protein